MTLFILDTDHVSLMMEGNTAIRRRKQQSAGEVTTSTVTVQEIFNGWLSRINAKENTQNPVPLYTKLWTTTEYFKDITIANYDDVAHATYQQMLKENPPLRKNRLQRDMRIAAIALSLGATLVTRNRRDFELVPRLSIADWSQPLDTDN
jgi:tRNA(fMet)-specific endonuclease VapC